MAPIFGFTALIIVLVISAFLPIYFFKTRQLWLKNSNPKNTAEFQKILFSLIGSSLVFAVIAQLCLIYSFITSDYSVSNVYQNSHHLKPLIYKISGSWGNHEGSMLLLITILNLYNFAFYKFSRSEEVEKITTCCSQSLIIALFAAFTALTSNPFLRIFPIPLEGLGLNPVLQDIGLGLHPPMLYLGYLGFSIIFSFTISGLIHEKIDQNFVKTIQPWLYFAWGFLTIGIGLGAWWAYRELGWGGYWFWDPVENVALMPWLVATALIHCYKVLAQKEMFKIWSAFLGLFTFILCLLGIFLVRSGVLTSVHSFAVDAARGFFVMLLILIIGGIGMIIFGFKISQLKTADNKVFFWSKIGTILLNNYFLIIALITVLLGTIYPIFLRGIFDEFIAIGPEYYNKIFSLLLLPFLLFLAISTKVSFSKNSKISDISTKSDLVILTISAILTALSFVLFHSEKISEQILEIIILFLAFLTTFGSLVFGRNLISKIAHLGFSLVILGVVYGALFNQTREMNLRQGEKFEIANYQVEFSKVGYDVAKNFLSRIGVFEISKNQQNIGQLKPMLNYYPVSDQSTNEADIRHDLSGDLYLVIGTKDENENYAVRAYFRPFIYLIWLGCLAIFAAAMLGFAKYFNRGINQFLQNFSQNFSQKD